MKILFAVQSALNPDERQSTAQRLVNLYPEAAVGAAKNPVTLKSVPGLAPYADLGISFLRAAATVRGTVYVIGSGALYRLTADGSAVRLGSVADSENTTISGNGANVTIAAGGTYYVWDGSALTTPSSGRIANVGTVDYLDGYTILTDADSGEFEWTKLGDAKTRNALNFATAESRNDNLLRVLVDRREVWLFGPDSSEIWYNTGASGANAFARMAGGAIDRGIAGANLVAVLDNSVFVVGDDRVAYRAAGSGFQAISGAAVNRALEAEIPTDVFIYEDAGHKFLCIRFAGRPAWCYDVATGHWHERASGISMGAWEVVGTAEAGGKWLGATRLGRVSVFGGVFSDNGAPLPRMAQSMPVYRDGARFTVDAVEILGKTGETLGRDARVMLQWSRDGGRAFGAEKWRSLGKTGDYRARAVWRAQGQFREATARITVTDPIDFSLYGANVELS